MIRFYIFKTPEVFQNLNIIDTRIASFNKKHTISRNVYVILLLMYLHVHLKNETYVVLEKK